MRAAGVVSYDFGIIMCDAILWGAESDNKAIDMGAVVVSTNTVVMASQSQIL